MRRPLRAFRRLAFRRLALRRLALRRLAVAATLATVAALSVSSCGVSVEAGARALPASELPPALAIPLGKTPPTLATGDGHGLVDVPVYFLFGANDSELRAVPTAVRQPVTLQAVLRALEDGPSTEQYAHGYATAVPADADFRVLGQPVRGVLSVELDSSYYQLSEQLAILELAQVVYTLVRAPGDLERVQFYSEGAKAGVLGGRGQYIPGPVSREDYASLFTSTS